jgi:site-specific recombinase XerD
MDYAYTSQLAIHIEGLIAEKTACGYPYHGGAYMLKAFDSFMESRFPEADTVTREAAYAWAERRDGEEANSLLNRISQVRQLALYMNRTGTYAFAPDGREFARRSDPAFHVFTAGELASFFKAADAYAQSRRAPWQQLTVPALFKTIYCLGLRPCEALRLNTGDVDTGRGTVDIYQSKGDKDRTVYMSDELAMLLCDFDRKVSRTLVGRAAFFPNGADRHYSTQTVRDWFVGIWHSQPHVAPEGTVPPLMSFRHTFATERLRLWASEGKDLRSHIYYLVEHMGHQSIKETEHYLHTAPQHFPEMLAKVGAISDSVIPEVV